jgi:hypothetical protein
MKVALLCLLCAVALLLCVNGERECCSATQFQAYFSLCSFGRGATCEGGLYYSSSTTGITRFDFTESPYRLYISSNGTYLYHVNSNTCALQSRHSVNVSHCIREPFTQSTLGSIDALYAGSPLNSVTVEAGTCWPMVSTSATRNLRTSELSAISDIEPLADGNNVLLPPQCHRTTRRVDDDFDIGERLTYLCQAIERAIEMRNQ